MNNSSQKFSRVWRTLLAAPILFLIGFLAASFYFGFVTQGQNMRRFLNRDWGLR